MVSKLKRFHADDRSDVDAMVARGLVPHDALLDRFRSAADAWAHCAHASDLPRYLDHLHEVERDMLGVDETEIDMPAWI